MREYQFYLNSVLMNDEPIGWSESKRKIIRSSEFKGLFVEYINDLEFHGDGYTTILNQIRDNGFCTEITVDIYYRCSQFDSFVLYFRGKIKMSEVELDLEKCTAKCIIEDNTIDAIINNFKDTEVRLDAAQTIGGLSLSSIANSLTIRDTTVFATTYPRTGYKISDVFQHILNYISDNGITFVSDFFQTTVSTRATTIITFNNPGVDLVGAGNVVIVYKNAFNVQTTLTIPKQATVALTLNYIISQFNFNATGTAEDKFYVQDYKYYPNVTTNGTTSITLLHDFLGFDLISCNVSATLADATSITNGMKNLGLINGNYLRNNNTKIPVLSFKEVFDEMDKLFDLGMSITTTLGVTTLRIEPYSYFFSSSSSLTLSNVSKLKRRSSKDFAKDVVKVGDGSDNKGNVGKQTSNIEWIVAAECSDSKVDLKNKWVVDTSECYEQLFNTDDAKDDKIFLFECESGSFSTIRYANTIYSTTTATLTSYYAYNAHLTNFWKIINWFFNLKGDVKHELYVMTNTSGIKILSEYEFESPLTFDEQENLINDRTTNIQFTYENMIYSGFVNEIIMNNKTGLSTFKLLRS